MKRYLLLPLLYIFCLSGLVQAAEPDFFTITNTHPSQKLTVTLRRGSSPPNNVTLYYRIIDAANNVGEWNSATTTNYDTGGREIGDIPAGSRMQLYGNNPSGFWKSSMAYWAMYIGGSGTAVLSGELVSLIFGSETSIDLTRTLPDNAFNGFFYNNNYKNTQIVSVKDLKLSPNLSKSCYANLFAYCSNLKDTPQLTAATLTANCYENMFTYCTSLTTPPELPATTLADNCYKSMFLGCSALTTAPELPATTLTEGCYQSMFKNCTALVNVPKELPGTNLPKNCYNEMFSGCTALTTAPEIMASEDAVPGQAACYNMFTDCTSLTTAPSVLRPRNINVNQVYYNMFLNCTSLQRGPDVWATTIKSGSNALFGLYQKASVLTHIRVHFKAWGSMSFCNQWSVGLPQKGAFYCPPELERNFTNTSWNHIPYSTDYPWTVFSYNLTYIPVEGEWPMGGTDPRQYTWETDTNYVQGWMRELDAAGATYWHDAACTQPFPEDEIIAFLATQQESSSDITKNIYVKLGEPVKLKITFVDHDNTELAVVEVAKGAVPAFPPDKNLPSTWTDGSNVYYFAGWTPDITAASEDATYKAVYSDRPRYEYVYYPLEKEDSQPDFDCKPSARPSVQTNDATSLSANGAVLNGQVVSDGGQPVTERGFCYGTNAENLTDCTAAGSGTGAFGFTLSGLTPATTYYVQAYATNNVGTAKGEVRSFTTEAEAGPVGKTCNHDWVVLWEGGPKWATVNIGATTETEAGNFYMYGGTEANPNCWWSNCPYKGTNQNTNPYTKYGVSGDGRLVLEAEDDAATQTWGCEWRTPTKAEMDDLKVYCNITCDAANRGIRCTSKTTGQSIFLPSAGYRGNGTGSGNTVFKEGTYGKYLTATSSATSGSSKDYDFYQFMWYTNGTYSAFDSGGSPSTSLMRRCIGMTVRAVCD